MVKGAIANGNQTSETKTSGPVTKIKLIFRSGSKLSAVQLMKLFGGWVGWKRCRLSNLYMMQYEDLLLALNSHAQKILATVLCNGVLIYSFFVRFSHKSTILYYIGMGKMASLNVNIKHLPIAHKGSSKYAPPRFSLIDDFRTASFARSSHTYTCTLGFLFNKRPHDLRAGIDRLTASWREHGFRRSAWRWITPLRPPR